MFIYGNVARPCKIKRCHRGYVDSEASASKENTCERPASLKPRSSGFSKSSKPARKPPISAARTVSTRRRCTRGARNRRPRDLRSHAAQASATGRAGGTEYWWFVLFGTIVFGLASLVDHAAFGRHALKNLGSVSSGSCRSRRKISSALRASRRASIGKRARRSSGATRCDGRTIRGSNS